MGTGKTPLVSVAILTYGEYSGLERTLKSVTEQDYPEVEVLVSDDCSMRDFPQEIIERYQARVSFQQTAVNRGTVAHMNGLANSLRGTYIKFVSAGDAFSSTDALTRLVQCAEKQGTLVTTSQALVCDSTLEKRLYPFPPKKQLIRLNATAKEQFMYLAGENCISAVGTLFHRDFFAKYGGISEEYRLLEDWPAWLRETCEGRRIGVLPEITCLYAAGGVSSKNVDAFASRELRQDMLHCYEREILPYEDSLPRSIKAEVRYKYALLREDPEKELIRNHTLRHLRTIVKRRAKRWLLKK